MTGQTTNLSKGPGAVHSIVMLLWGVASEALRDIVTRFLDEVRFQ